jgi:hypothetical protein
MEGWEIIQNCELSPGTGAFGKRKFISEIEHCRTYLHLAEFHSRNQGAWVTDNIRLVNKNHTSFWMLTKIDFDAPVNFVRVQ